MAQGHPKFLWWNGRQMPWEEATVHVTDIGWSTVGAIFEGIRAYWNPDQQEAYVFRLPEHMKRFSQSMKLVRLQQDYATEQLIDAIVRLARENDHREDVYIRPFAYRGSGDGKSFSGFGSAAQILINTHGMPSHLLKGKTQAACISSWTRISDNVMPPRVKNISNYRNGQLANMEAATNGYDTAIILNKDGHVAEGGGACLMMVRDGKLITPGVSESILESITRDAIMTMAREDLGIEVVERTIDRTELYICRRGLHVRNRRRNHPDYLGRSLSGWGRRAWTDHGRSSRSCCMTSCAASGIATRIGERRSASRPWPTRKTH